ncbi:bifunctional DNA primase/polymerase [Actinomyces provencensis]|uniref:bifunctional DNA primase/polymerase n=1 Tax=Actinomyces provencensis TaxID=1720198 RepID=UPI0018A84F9C|nr:bifunctional DNA primase/polymerase [Actinomyces provencensis]
MAEHGAVSSVLLLRMSGAWPLSAAAREFASAGVPVFPCVSYGKRPATGHGFYDATTNLDQIEAWWRQSPGANIGVPTGAASGAVVVDVDVHGPVDGHAGFDRAARAGLVDGWELLVRTPTGGMHAYYPATPDTEQRSWQAGRAGIDFRGDGGYIIVPPSLRSIEGTTVGYRVEAINTGPAGLLDSDALRDFLDPRPAPRPRTETWQPVGRKDAQRLALWLDRQETDRNLKLFWASCRLAEGGVPLTDALDAVLAAAKSDFGPREITATVRSAYRTVRGEPARRGPSSSLVRGEPPVAADGWFSRDPARPSTGPSRVRGL